MIKRMALLVAMSIFMTCSSAVAEDFTFRNGITFHDSWIDVLDKEVKSIEYTVSDNSYYDKLHSKLHNFDTGFHQYPITFTTEKGELAGIPDSCIVYSFNNRNTLREAEYIFKRYKSSSKIEQPLNDFEEIEQMLISKYKDPINCSDVEQVYAVQSRSFEEGIQYVMDELSNPSNNGFLKFSEWVIDCTDYHVKIDHFIFCKNKSIYSYEYHHRLCYSYFTDDDLYAILHTTPTPEPSPTPTINPIDDL